MNIGDLFLSLLADGSRLEQDVVKQADKAGAAGEKALGKRLSSGLKTGGVRAFSLAFGAAATVVTRGSLEMENSVADFASQTGASMDEAGAAMKGVNRIAGDQRMSLDAVKEAAIRVRRDLGLTGAEAEKATEDFAEFARVTRQDAAGAVEDFDDILDAWGLEAKDARKIQDQLIVSNQKYGGSIQDSQKALAAFAPQLQALGATYEDGIGLLNLFAASGLDSAKATFALNTAVKNLKPGESLDDLIAQVSAIEDPTKRAQKAIELFGARGGVSLANVLRPGIDSLEDFQVTAEESGGAVDEAAEKIDSTFSGRIKKAISQATAALRGFGAEVGPVASALASIGLLASSVFPDLGPALGRKITAGFKLPVGPLKRIGMKVMAMIGVGVASSAAADVVADSLGDAVTGAAKGGKLSSATQALGKFMGSKLGMGLAVGFAAVAWVEVINTYNRIREELASQNAAIDASVMEQIRTGTSASLEQSKRVLTEQLQELNGVWDAGLFTTETRKKLEANLAATTAELERRAAGLGPAVGAGIDAGAPAVEGAVDSMMDDAEGRVRGGSWGEAGAEIPTGISAGIVAEQSKVTDALADLRSAIKSELTPGKEIARNIGILTSKELAKGLKDKRPGVRAEAERVRAVAEERLATLIKNGGRAGKKGSEALAAGLKSKNPKIRAAAERVREIVASKMNKIPPAAGKTGARAGSRFISNFKRSISTAGIVTIKVRTSDTTIGGRARGGPITAGVPFLVNEQTPRSEVMVPSTGGYILTRSQAEAAMREGGRSSGGDTYNVPVNVNGALPVRTIRDISTELQRLGSLGILPARSIAPEYRRRETRRGGTRP